jgi:GT2 family glycosyltransferase
MTIAVVVPGLRVAGIIGNCLDAIARSSRAPDEIIFFDDGSDDDSARVAEAHGARVIRNTGAPLGPGMGRNRATQTTDCDLILFVDSDVVVHPDALGLLADALGEPAVVAAFGSYDDRPPEPGIGSRYVNLRHHFVHQNGPRLASTFWAGIGMVRRSAFEAIGGFSIAYGRPSIEDIELGTRMINAGGRIRLVPSAQGTHLKRWDVLQLWKTDIFSRAIPWARLIAEGKTPGADLNASSGERVAAVLVHLAVFALLLAIWTPWMLAVAAILVAAYCWQNRAFFGFLAKRVPLRLLPGMVALHGLYHIYASQIFAWTMLLHRLRARQPGVSAPSGM